MKTKIIGLTGGIGSGKTTIAKYFASLGVPVYIADEEAKKILYRADAADAVKSTFGAVVFTEDKPDRAKLAAMVFNNPEKLELLNDIIHPRVKEHFAEWLFANSDSGFVIKEAAILFESGSYKQCDKVILVTAPEETRIERVMKRDNTTRDKVLNRMANQWNDERKKQLSDYIIDNIDLEIAKNQAYNIYINMKNI